jgi:hypothetical protein
VWRPRSVFLSSRLSDDSCRKTGTPNPPRISGGGDATRDGLARPVSHCRGGYSHERGRFGKCNTNTSSQACSIARDLNSRLVRTSPFPSVLYRECSVASETKWHRGFSTPPLPFFRSLSASIGDQRLQGENTSAPQCGDGGHISPMISCVSVLQCYSCVCASHGHGDGICHADVIRGSGN